MKLIIDISKDRYDEIMAMDWKNGTRIYDEEIRAIHEGKSIEKEQKTGHWNCGDDMFEYAICSSCKHETGEAWEYAKRNFKYCPNCGAKMKEGD